MKQTTIAIVGGGANGVASFIHLVIKLIIQPVSIPVSIVLLEKEAVFGPGLAYGTHQKGHLLNTEAKLMGIFAEEPNHFVTWCQENQALVQEHFPQLEIYPYAFPPRALYGLYLQSVLQEYVQLAREKGLAVELRQDEAMDAEVTGNQINLQLHSGSILTADVVVLATGTPKPNNFPHLKESPRYFDFPWPAQRLLQQIPRHEPVSILGTSLTAIDTVMTFLDNDHTGHLTLYSRHGLIPRVQTPFDVGFKREMLTLENMRKIIREKKRPLRAKDLFRLFIREAERLIGKQESWKKFNRIGKPHLGLLQYDLDVALKGESDFQNIAYSTRFLCFEAWKLLPEDEKIRFTKWLAPHWDINRNSMPLENARKLLNLLEAGKLTIKAQSSKVEWNPDEQKFYLHLENGAMDRAIYLINATGTAKKLEKMELPLLQQMLQKNLLVPFKPGGVKADVNSLQIHIPNNPNVLLYGTGQLLNGELLDTNSVWFNVACIDRMTNHILAQLAHGRTK